MSPEDDSEQYELDVAPPAARVIAEVLPEAIAWAITDFITGPLLRNPRQVGGRLHGRYEGMYSAHVGEYRVVYEIREWIGTVRVVCVGRRADVYGIG